MGGIGRQLYELLLSLCAKNFRHREGKEGGFIAGQEWHEVAASSHDGGQGAEQADHLQNPTLSGQIPQDRLHFLTSSK